MKFVLTNYLSTAEETEAASVVVLDAFTQFDDIPHGIFSLFRTILCKP